MIGHLWQRILGLFTRKRTRVLIVVRGVSPTSEAAVQEKVRKWLAGETACLAVSDREAVEVVTLDTSAYCLCPAAEIKS